MARINKVRYVGCALMLLAALQLSGCSAYLQSQHARSAFEEAEQFAEEENFDQAIVKYTEAVKLEPASKTYKLKLVSAQTRAAAAHVRTARTLANEGKYAAAVEEYRTAKSFDPSVEVAVQEEQEVLDLLEAERLAEEGANFWGKRNLLLARKAIDAALRLNPQNARALAIKDLLDREQKKVAMDGIDLDVTSEEPITLSFKDANIKEVFGILSKLSGINFIFDEEIRTQSISVLLEKASFLQAMELIMQMNGLGKKVLNSKTIIIYPQSREKDKQYGDQIIQTFYLSHIDAKKAVNLLRTMLQLRKIFVHEERNALVIRDTPVVVRLAEQILAAADRSDSEVLFDVEVLSVRDTENLNFGPRLSQYSTTVGFAVPGAEGVVDSIPSSIVTGSLSGLETFYTVPSATFDYAKTLSTTELLASPKIRVKNKEKAKVHIGKRDPVVTTSGSTSDSGFTSQSVQYVDSGIKLDIEPTVQLDGTVLTKIKLEVSTAERLDDTDTTGESPIALTTTNAETSLVLLDGARTILGGLYESNNTNNKTMFPLIGDIPLIGSLFTNFSDTEEKREIILSITPYIIKKVEVPDIDVATIWSGGEDDLKNGPNFGAFAQNLISEVESTKPQSAPAVESMQPENATDVEMASEEVPQTADSLEATEDTAIEEEAALNQPSPANGEGQTATEGVPTEVLEDRQEVAPPLVLEMPDKGLASLQFNAPSGVEKDQEFSVALQVNDIENLYSAPLFIKYDPAILEFVSLNEGPFLKQDGQSTVFSSSPNRTTGQIIVGYKQGTGAKGASGSGVLFNLNFKPRAEGDTTLEVNRVNFRNPEGVRLQVAPETVTIEIR